MWVRTYTLLDMVVIFKHVMLFLTIAQHIFHSFFFSRPFSVLLFPLFISYFLSFWFSKVRWQALTILYQNLQDVVFIHFARLSLHLTLALMEVSLFFEDMQMIVCHHWLVIFAFLKVIGHTWSLWSSAVFLYYIFCVFCLGYDAAATLARIGCNWSAWQWMAF